MTKTPYLQIKKCTISGPVEEYFVNTSGNSSDVFDLPAHCGMYISVYTGEHKNDWTGENKGYTWYLTLNYQYDEAPPNAPDKPWITSCNNGDVYQSGDTIYTNSSVSIQWNTATDNGSLFNNTLITSGIKEYSIYDNEIYQDITSNLVTTYTFTGLWQGEHRIQLKSRDNEGYYSSSSSESLNFYVDTTKPDIPENLRITNSTLNGFAKDQDITWTWDIVTDNASGIKEYRVHISENNGTPTVTTTSTNSYTHFVEDGKTYSCQVQAVDNVGNCGELSTSGHIQVDRSVPQVDLPTYPIHLNGDQVSFNWIALSDPGAGLQYYEVALTNTFQDPDLAAPIEKNSTIETSYSFTTKISSKNNYYAWVRGVDRLGNQGPWKATVSFPEYTINGPEEDVFSNNLTPSITVHSISGKTLKYQVGYRLFGLPQTTRYSPLSDDTIMITLADGIWEWWLEIYEAENGEIITESKQVTESFSLKIDSTIPPNDLNSFLIKSRVEDRIYNEENPANNKVVAITNLKLADNPGGSGIKGIYLWNGDPITPPIDAVYKILSETNAPIDWTLADGPDGIRTVNMQVVDNAGNTTLVTYQVKLDTNPPAVPGQFSHTAMNDKINFTWRVPKTEFVTFRGTSILPDNAEKAFTVTPTLTGEAYIATHEVPVTGFGPNQPVTLKVHTIDSAGNESVETPYTAYTKAALGTIQALASGYDPGLKQHYLKWQLNQIPGSAKSYLLEYGSKTSEGFTIEGSITPDTGGIIFHGNLIPHGTYHYRLVALNESGDRTEGEIFTRQVPNAAPERLEHTSPVDYASNKVIFDFTAVDYDKIDNFIYHLFYQEEGGTLKELTNATPVVNINEDGDRTYHWHIEVDNSSSNSMFKDGRTYNWHFAVDDQLGEANSMVFSDTYQFKIDKNQPVLTIEEPYRPYSNQKQLNITVSDNLSGVAKVTYQKIAKATNEVLAEGEIDLSPIALNSYAGNIQLTEGEYHLHFIAWDKAGNSQPLELNNVSVDQTLPEISQVVLDLIQDGGRYLTGNGKLPVSFQAVDNLSRIKELRYWIVENQTATLGAGKCIPLSPDLEQYAHTLELSGETGKQYYLVLAVEDQAGNRSEATYLGPILLDLTPPQVNLTLSGLTNFGAGQYTSDLTKLNLEASAGDSESGISNQELSIVETTTGQYIATSADWTVLKNTTLIAGDRYRIIFRAVNGVGQEAETKTEEFIYDSTEPQNLKITGPTGSLISGEQAVFTIAAAEPESFIVKYRFAIVSPSGEKITALVPGNQDGWLVLDTNTAPVQFRVELPVIPDDTYYPVVEIVNAAGLKSATSGNIFTINNNQEKVAAGDQGPYTMFASQLTGWWRYIGTKTVSEYQYRILDQDNQVVRDWQTTIEKMITVQELQLESGKKYYFEAKAKLSEGTETESGRSPGVTVDITRPEITSLITPEYTGSANLTLRWNGEDSESGINRVQAALGSDYYRTDVTGGWVDLAGNNAILSRKTNGEALNLTTGKRYYLTLRMTNGAGLAAEQAASGIMIDDTPPPVPGVADQGAVINTNPYQPLEANWIWTLTDPESVTVKYQWALIEHGQDIATATWHDGDSTMRVSLSMAEFPRQHGKTYYFAIKATNGAGLQSIGYSNGIMVDATAPIIPKVTLLNALNLGDPNAPEINYLTNNNQLGLWINSYDPETTIDNYQYTWGAPAEVDGQPRENSATAGITLANPEIDEGELTVFLGECSNEAQLVSATGYSNGVILDTSAPQIINVRGGVSGNNFYFDWEVIPSVSPVAFYEIALVPEAEMNSTPAAWTKVGLNRSLVLDGTARSDGNYRLLIRGCNQAGTYSRRQGDLNEWGTSPRITLDRQPPIMKALTYDNFAANELKVQAAAEDATSGIGGYQYAFGSKANPYQYNNGWADITEKTSWVQFNIPTMSIPQAAEVYLMVRVKDNVGLWSEAKVSSRILIDHTGPTTPELTSGAYTKSKSQISGIGFQSEDPESGLTHYRLGLVSVKGEPWLYTQETAINEFDGKLSGLALEEAGRYYLAMQTKNGAGEWSEAGYSQLITVDTIPPVLIFTKGDQTVVLNHPPVGIEYTLSEPAEVKLILTGLADGSTKQFIQNGITGTNVFEFQEILPQTYQLTGAAVDPAGNPGLEADEQLIRVNAPPQITLPAELHTRPGATIQFGATVIDPDVSGGTIEYQWDPGDEEVILTGAVPEYKYMTLGEYTLTVTATDGDGGVTTATAKVKVQNTTEGTLCMNETWSGTHHIYGDVIVPENITLTILSGTEIVAGENSSLIIQGDLNIENGARFSSAMGTIGSWNGIYIEGTATMNLVTIIHAVRGLAAIDSVNVTVIDCIFQMNQVGLHVYGTSPSVTRCSFLDNSLYGIKEDEGGRPVVVGCIFRGNGMDYYHETLTEITMDELNGITGNRGNGK